MDKIDKQREYFFVGLMTLFALLIRLFNINIHMGLWLDEVLGYHIAQQASLVELFKVLLFKDIHAPIFFVILHYWIKLVGSNDILLWILPVTFSTLCVPCGYSVAKKLFNQRTAYFFALILAFSGFQIYYAQELKFYSLLSLLSIFFAYYFIRYLNTFRFKHLALLFLINFLIIYTFNIGIIFVFCSFIVGLVYLLLSQAKDNKKNVINFIIANGLLFALFLPYLFFQVNTILNMRASICSLSQMFHFDWGFLQTLMQNYFSPYFINPTNNPINYSIFSLIKEPFFLLVVIVSILIGFLGLFLAVRTKNKASILLVCVSVLFIVCEIVLAILNVVPIVTRYTILAHPLILMALAYGVASLNRKKLVNWLFVLAMVLSLVTFGFSKTTVLWKGASHYPIIAHYLNQYEVKGNDYVMMPYYGKVLHKYFSKGKQIDFRSEEVLLTPDYKLTSTVLGLDPKNITKQNSKVVLYPYLKEHNPPNTFEEYFVDEYFSKMKKGERFFLVVNYLGYIIPEKTLYSIINDYQVYQNADLYKLLYSSIIYKTITMCNRQLRLVKVQDLSNLDIMIMVYEKP